MKTLKKLRQQSREEDLMLESTEGQEEVVTLGTNIWEDEYEPIPLSSFISSKQPVDIVQFNPGEIEDTLAPLQMHEANDWLLAEFLKMRICHFSFLNHTFISIMTLGRPFPESKAKAAKQDEYKIFQTRKENYSSKR